MYAQRGSVGRTREHADYATLRQNQSIRDCGCHVDMPGTPLPPQAPTTPSCLNGYPLAMVYAPTQAFDQLYDCEQWLEKGTIFKALDFPFRGTRKGR